MRSEWDLVSDFRTYSRINRAIAAGCASCHHRLLRIAVSRAISASGDDSRHSEEHRKEQKLSHGISYVCPALSCRGFVTISQD